MSGPHPPPPNTLDALRERVLRAGLAVLAVGMPITATLVVVQGALEHQLNLRTFLITGGMGCFPLLWVIAPRLKFRTAAGIFVGLLILSALLLASRGVLTVGYAAVDILAILSATLFFGRTGAVVGMCAVVGAHLTGWAIVNFDLGPPPAINLIDPRLPAVWIRHVLVLVMLGTVITVTVVATQSVFQIELRKAGVAK